MSSHDQQLLLIKISLAFLNTFGSCLKILSVFLCNILPAEAAPNEVSHILPNSHANMVRHEFLSCFRLWHGFLLFGLCDTVLIMLVFVSCSLLSSPLLCQSL